MSSIIDLRKERDMRAINRTIRETLRAKCTWLVVAAKNVIFNTHVFAAPDPERDVIRILVHPADTPSRVIGIVEMTREQWLALIASADEAWACAARIRNPET